QRAPRLPRPRALRRAHHVPSHVASRVRLGRGDGQRWTPRLRSRTRVVGDERSRPCLSGELQRLGTGGAAALKVAVWSARGVMLEMRGAQEDATGRRGAFAETPQKEEPQAEAHRGRRYAA